MPCDCACTSHLCMLFHVVPCHCMFLHVVACRCSMSLHIVACRCMSLHIVACRSRSLHVVACRCISLHVVACRCMSLHILACFCMLLHVVTCRCDLVTGQVVCSGPRAGASCEASQVEAFYGWISECCVKAARHSSRQAEQQVLFYAYMPSS